MNSTKLSIVFIIIAISVTAGILGLIKLNPIEPHVTENIAVAEVYFPASPLKEMSGVVPFRAYGTLSSNKNAMISGLVGGKIVEVSPNSRTGKYIKKDEVLYSLDSTEVSSKIKELKDSHKIVEIQLLAAKKQIDHLISEKKLSEESYELALREFNRFVELTKVDVAASDLLDQANAKLIGQKLALINIDKILDAKLDEISTLNVQLSEINEKLIQAEFQLKNMIVVAPFDGIVESSSLELGMVMQPSVSFLTLYSPYVWEVELFIPVELQRLLKQDSVANLIFANSDGKNLEAKYSRMSGSFNPKTRMAGAIFTFSVSEQQKFLLNHLFVTADILFTFDRPFSLIQKEMIRNEAVFFIENEMVSSEKLKDFIDLKHMIVCFDESKFNRSIVLNPDKFIHDGMKAKSIIREK